VDDRSFSANRPQDNSPAFFEEIRRPLAILRSPQGGLVCEPVEAIGNYAPGSLIGILPPLYPEWLGGRSFTSAHELRFPYVVGEMARGIATPAMAVAAAQAGFQGFFGSAGLPLAEIETGVAYMQAQLGPDRPGWGANLIHSPQEPTAEMATVELLLRQGVTRVSASAFMALAPAALRFAATGLTRGGDGRINRRNHLFAKVSRPEVARHFLSPAPAAMLRGLVEAAMLTAEEAELASRIPVAEDITVEADSGGHTDGRPLTVLLPVIATLRDRLSAEHGYVVTPRIGAAGGLGTPAALAAAFAAGAAYVVTGSVNQCSRESGLSADAQAMLATAGAADVAMAPAADMFELGAKVQVLRRGTMFAQRAQRLYEVYGRYDSIEAIPAEERRQIESQVLGHGIEEIWAETKAHFARRSPEEVTRAEREPRHRMALVFRWYLFMASQWARDGVTARRMDYQIWCGAAMGAFNDWVRGSFLEAAEQRGVVQIGRNLLEGAAIATRAHQLRLCGIDVPTEAFNFAPRPLG
jgi:trans-AT polyketide synthase/acyltransferase/oxidoreductase domain-containing protein